MSLPSLSRLSLTTPTESPTQSRDCELPISDAQFWEAVVASLLHAERQQSLQSLLDDRFKGANNRGMYVEGPEGEVFVRFGLKPTKLANLQAEQMLTEYASYQQIGVPLKAAWVAPNYSFATRVNDLKRKVEKMPVSRTSGDLCEVAQHSPPVPSVTDPEEEGTMVLVMAAGTGAFEEVAVLDRRRTAKQERCTGHSGRATQQPLLEGCP